MSENNFVIFDNSNSHSYFGNLILEALSALPTEDQIRERIEESPLPHVSFPENPTPSNQQQD